MEEDIKPLEWHIEKHQLKNLVPLEKNPFGKIDARKKKRLEEKILTLGVFEAPACDENLVLLSFNKRHAILMELGRGEELQDVLVPNRALTEKERKEIILSSNVHEGNWIEEILREDFADMDLAELGIDVKAMDDILAEGSTASKAKSEDPVYPIVAEFSEKHDAFIIISSNEIDSNFLKQVLQLEKSQSYKSEAVGQSHVVTAKDFISLWNSKSSS
ncbi:hypothetical protein [Pontibacter mangrovi]|uniref:Uncharacterized protein n=1 Tax=Pontibacter mangrovi TaxID=2589816 RepID=A0A501W7B9_9BACT|nr:hypothetical protein [Pontibacter mangrovi]TPE43974.1 hypothetical protein FJM65_11150 [Pontibacter mangrovi]